MTFSIVARDAHARQLGVAVASKFLAVGAVVPWATAGVGAVATQALANTTFGPDGLAGMAAGASAGDALARLLADDDGRDHRQVGMVDNSGVPTTYTGAACLPWAGGRTAAGVAAQGNILTGPAVVDAMLTAFADAEGPLPDRLIDAILAGDRAGGDARGRQSAAVLVVRAGEGYGGTNDRWIDLRVDDHPDPVPELRRLLGVWRMLSERPTAEDLLAIDPDLAAELHDRLRAAGWAPGRRDVLAETARASLVAERRVGKPRDAGPGWDAGWDDALLGWMGVANLEERTAASGWIDPVVLDELRRTTDRRREGSG